MKIFILLGVLCSLNFSMAEAKSSKSILMLISEGFYAPEYFKPRALFDKAGFKVEVAAKYNHPVAPDRRQINSHPKVTPDVIFKDVNVDKYDAIFFAGGNGAWEDFFPNEDVHKILTNGMKKNKKVALLCSATGLLGVANNLNGMGVPIAKGKKVTGYKRVVGLLKVLGQIEYYGGEKGRPFVMVDGNLITGRDPSSSELTAQTVIKELDRE